MDREQLLMGLYYVRERIDRMLVLCEGERRLEVQVRDEVVEFQDKGIKGGLKTLILIFGAASLIMELLLLLVFGKWEEQIGFFIATAAGYFYLLPKIISNSLVKTKLTIAAGIALFMGAMGGAITRGGVIGFILFAIIVGGTVPLYIAFIQGHKSSVKKKNDEIRARNQRIYAEYDKIKAEEQVIQKELAVEANNWYPRNYCNKEAIDWFIIAVENYRCDNIKELIREFEADNRHRQMMQAQERLRIEMNNGFNQIIRNQQQMQSLMRVNNMLASANLATAIENGRRIEANTAAVNRATTAINSAAGTDVYYTPPSF